MNGIEIIGAVLTIGAAIVARFWIALRKERKAGAEQQRAEDAIETAKRVQRGQEAVNRGRASGASNADRVRSNDQRWN
jgi:uncharacterized membrane protein YcjF (UPF0283 family)